MAGTIQRRLRQEAHLWLKRLTDEALPATPDTLSVEELARAEEIRHPRARQHFAAGRHFTRQVLSQYVPIDPREWLFETSAEGRPEVATPDTASALRFNISHTDGIVACLVTERIDCGVDVESLDRRVDAMRIAAHSFAPEELTELEACLLTERSTRFLELWTLKEAYLKALGSGIRLRLDAVRFQVTSDGLIRHRVSDAAPETNDEWQFSLFQPDPSHLLATAIHSGAAANCAVLCWELDSLSRRRQLDLPMVASTTTEAS